MHTYKCPDMCTHIVPCSEIQKFSYFPHLSLPHSCGWKYGCRTSPHRTDAPASLLSSLNWSGKGSAALASDFHFQYHKPIPSRTLCLGAWWGGHHGACIWASGRITIPESGSHETLEYHLGFTLRLSSGSEQLLHLQHIYQSRRASDSQFLPLSSLD